MVELVSWNDIDQSLPQNLSIDGTPKLISRSRLNQPKRSFISITPTTAGVTATVTLGSVSVAALQGTPLVQSQPFVQSLDANGKGVFQGDIWVTGSAAGNISVAETFENGGVQ